MSNKLLYIIIALLVVVVAGGTYVFLGGKAPGNQPAGQPAGEESAADLSEQPDKVKFNEFFTSIFVAKLPVGAKFEPSKIVKTSVFSAGEQFCTSINMKKQVPADTLSSSVYDVSAKQDFQPRGGAFPQAMGPGNSIGCESLSEPVGQYEYKIYLNDDLVAVMPFEVK